MPGRQHPIPHDRAMHEAGHAVVGISLGRSFQFVFVRSPSEPLPTDFVEREAYMLLGGVRGGEMLGIPGTPPELTEIRRPALLAQAKSTIAGSLAEGTTTRRFRISESRSRDGHWLSRPRPELPPSFDDTMDGRLLDGFLRELCSNPRERAQLRLTLQRETLEILGRKEVWSAVNRVADALQVHRRLEFDDVLEIAGCAWRFGEPAVWPGEHRSYSVGPV